MKLTQQDASRIMFAHEKAADARAKLHAYCGISTPLRREYDAAEQRFAALVASLTESEGL
jgi:hypothetical protein